jgi:hypothetical protein
MSKISTRDPLTGLGNTAWMKTVLYSRPKVCVVSGVTENLEGHRLYDVYGYPEHQWEANNVVVVSSEVHKKFHVQYMGDYRVHGTPSDWESFVKEYRENRGFIRPRGYQVSSRIKEKIRDTLVARHDEALVKHAEKVERSLERWRAMPLPTVTEIKFDDYGNVMPRG